MAAVEVAAGRYVTERRIGQGGMATVYLARDGRLDRPVALKLLADNLAGDSAFRRRFEREARLAGRLSHPNVVQVFDVGEEDGRPYIVMELVEGSTLADRLRGGRRLKPDEAVSLLTQVAAGLGHAHDCGLVHRDVKPANLLLRRDGRLKIADFGIARALEETSGITRPGFVLGTAPYLAPEQVRGDDASAATDVYGCGVVGYEMLTGRTPYDGSSIETLADAHRNGGVEPPGAIARRVPPALDALIMRMLDSSPTRRPQSGGAVEEELRTIAAEDGRRTTTRRGGTAVMPAPAARPSTGSGAEAATEVLGPARSRLAGIGAWIRRRPAPAAAVALVALGLAFFALAGSGGGGDELSSSPAGAGETETSGAAPTATPPPIPQEADPADQARALANWLRARSR